MKIELVYEKTCPNVDTARAQLAAALRQAGLDARWQEWEVSSPQAPAHVHGYGSPTILVDRRDVTGAAADGHDLCCRVYETAGSGDRGVPARQDIMRAIASASQSNNKTGGGRWSLNGAMLPAVGAAFLPKLTCPTCWPAYAGLLSSMGIGFFDYTPLLVPLTLVFLLIALAALAWRAPRRRGYRPLLLGVLAAVVLVAGKFGFDSDGAMYSGLGLLVAASAWNTWPRRAHANGCPACEV